MCRAIAECHAVDEVKDLRDKALAIEEYMRRANNPEPERRACAIRLRAERKAGQLLKQMERAKAANGRPRKASSRTRLSDLGVSYDQSSKWQKLADVPEDDFEAVLAGPGKPSTTGIINRREKQKPMDPDALWVWGRLRDFERKACLSETRESFFPN